MELARTKLAAAISPISVVLFLSERLAGLTWLDLLKQVHYSRRLVLFGCLAVALGRGHLLYVLLSIALPVRRVNFVEADVGRLKQVTRRAIVALTVDDCDGVEVVRAVLDRVQNVDHLAIKFDY